MAEQQHNDTPSRHRRQIALDGWNDEAQKRLVGSYVVVVGAGAIGGALATHLAAAGVERIGIVDGGVVDDDALGGQIVHFTPDRGAGKADSIAHKVGLLNPDVQADAFPASLDHQNSAAIVAGATLVADCGRDGVATLWLASACAEAGLTLLVGTAAGWRGATLALAPGADLPSAQLPQASDEPALAGAVAAAVAADLLQRAMALASGVGDAGIGVLHEFNGRDGSWTRPDVGLQLG